MKDTFKTYRSLGNFRGINFSRVIISCDNIVVVWGYPQTFFNGTIYTNLVPRHMEYETVASLT